MIDKIRYRLVYNRTNKLNNQQTALVQIEASLNKRKVYFTTNVYLKPECWSKERSQVINHPQSNELNAMLYQNILDLQAVEIDCWKRGITATLSILKESIKKHVPTSISFTKFCIQSIQSSGRRSGTKVDLMTTVTALKQFRHEVEFSDITYTFLKDFENFLIAKNLKTNTIAKHIRNVRTMVNEAINQGYIRQDDYPFRKFKIKHEKTEHNFLRPEELRRLEKFKATDGNQKNNPRHVLDAFLFCCYTGLRFSDFKQLRSSNIVTIRGRQWLTLSSIKTGIKLNIPLYLLFSGKALEVLARYESMENLSSIGCNADTNRVLHSIGKMAGIKRPFTFHVARHTCASLLVHDGVPITTVQTILGHTSIRTTQIYAEVFGKTIIRDLTKANNLKNKNKNGISQQNPDIQK